MNEFEKRLKQMEEADIDEAQDRDFYMWNEYLIEFPQRLYDFLGSHELDYEMNELTPEEIRERRAVLDCAYLYIQQAMSDVSQFIRKKYANDVEKENLKLNI